MTVMSPFGIATIRPIPHSSEHFVALQNKHAATDFLRPTFTLPPSHVKKKKKLRPAISRICLLAESNPWLAFCHSDLSVRCFKACFHRTTVGTVRQYRRAEITFWPFQPYVTTCTVCCSVGNFTVCPNSTIICLLV